MTYKELQIANNCAKTVETAKAVEEMLNSNKKHTLTLKIEDGREYDLKCILSVDDVLAENLEDIKNMREDAAEMLTHFSCDLSDKDSHSKYPEDKEIE